MEGRAGQSGRQEVGPGAPSCTSSPHARGRPSPVRSPLGTGRCGVRPTTPAMGKAPFLPEARWPVGAPGFPPLPERTVSIPLGCGTPRGHHPFQTSELS